MQKKRQKAWDQRIPRLTINKVVGSHQAEKGLKVAKSWEENLMELWPAGCDTDPMGLEVHIMHQGGPLTKEEIFFMMQSLCQVVISTNRTQLNGNRTANEITENKEKISVRSVVGIILKEGSEYKNRRMRRFQVELDPLNRSGENRSKLHKNVRLLDLYRFSYWQFFLCKFQLGATAGRRQKSLSSSQRMNGSGSDLISRILVKEYNQKRQFVGRSVETNNG